RRLHDGQRKPLRFTFQLRSSNDTSARVPGERLKPGRDTPEFFFCDPCLLTALHKKSRRPSSLCNLCVLCVSVVDEFQAKTHHRDTEVAQRNQYVATLCAKPFVN